MSTTDPFNIMPRHLNIPTGGPAYPVNAPPLAPGTPLQFTGINAPAPNSLGGRLAAAGGGQQFPTAPPTANPLIAHTPSPSPTSTPSQSILSRFRNSSPLTGRGLARGALRGTGIGLASEIGGTALGNAIGGNQPDTPGFDRRDLGQATTGAARGAGLGFMLGGGYGALAGGVLGGAAGALDVFGEGGPLESLNIFAGDDGGKSIDTTKALDKMMTWSELPTSSRDSIKAIAREQLELATSEEEKVAVLQNTGAMIQQHHLQQEQSQQQLAHSLALQAQAAQIFAPFAEQNQRTADLARQTYGQIASSLPDSYKGLAEMFSQNAQQQSDALTQNLYTTAIARPRIDALVAQQQQIDSVAAQIVQQAQAAALTGGMGGGGGVDIDALLAGTA